MWKDNDRVDTTDLWRSPVSVWRCVRFWMWWHRCRGRPHPHCASRRGSGSASGCGWLWGGAVREEWVHEETEERKKGICMVSGVRQRDGKKTNGIGWRNTNPRGCEYKFRGQQRERDWGHTDYKELSPSGMQYKNYWDRSIQTAQSNAVWSIDLQTERKPRQAIIRRRCRFPLLLVCPAFKPSFGANCMNVCDIITYDFMFSRLWRGMQWLEQVRARRYSTSLRSEER